MAGDSFEKKPGTNRRSFLGGMAGAIAGLKVAPLKADIPPENENTRSEEQEAAWDAYIQFKREFMTSRHTFVLEMGTILRLEEWNALDATLDSYAWGVIKKGQNVYEQFSWDKNMPSFVKGELGKRNFPDDAMKWAAVDRVLEALSQVAQEKLLDHKL